MTITRVYAIPVSDPVPPERQHRTDLGTKAPSRLSPTSRLETLAPGNR
jgi:hypothetical protein